MSLIKTIQEEMNQEQIHSKMINRKKVEKWRKFGLLEGLKDKRERVRMARLLENEAKGLLESKSLLEASDTSDIKGFQAIAFPLVRRVFGQLLAQEITSVQPMSLPAGLLFWLDFTYGTSKAGNGSATWAPGQSVYGDPLAPLTGGADATGGHYYLHNSYTQREATGSLGVASSGSATWSEVDFDPELSGAVAGSMLYKLTVDFDQDATITNVDPTAYKSFAVKGETATLGATFVPYPRHNSYNATTGVLTVFYSGAATDAGGPNSGTVITASYVKKDVHGADTTGTTLNPAYEYAFDSSDLIPEIDMKIASHAVVANSRKLKVKWTPEVAQDLNAYHTLDAEAELTQVMADHISLDVDSEILVDMVNNASAAKYFWDRRPGFFLDKETGERLADAPSFTGNVQEWYLTLMETISDVSNVISRKTLRVGANFIVVGPDVATILENIVQWRPVLSGDSGGPTKFSMGIEKIGTLANRFTVYKAPFFYRNKILVGHKGSDWLSTGYVYAPYIPMIVTPTVYDPTNFTPNKAVMTRYAKQVVRGDMYGLVVVKGMGIF